MLGLSMIKTGVALLIAWSLTLAVMRVASPEARAMMAGEGMLYNQPDP